MNLNFKQFLTHFFVLVLFALAALAYFYPVLQGKTIYQSDIVQYRGMAHEQEDFRARTGEALTWEAPLPEDLILLEKTLRATV